MSPLREDTIGLARSQVPGAAALLAAGIGVLCYHLGSDRLDFAAHYVAGLGGTMLLLSLVTLLPPVLPRAWAALAVTALSCGIGAGGEALIFVEGGFDLVDVSNQSLGAVTAGLIFVSWPVDGAVALAVWVLLALAFLGGGAWLVGFW